MFSRSPRYPQCPKGKSPFESRPSRTVEIPAGTKIIGTGGDDDLVCPRRLSICLTRGGPSHHYVASASGSADSKAPWIGRGVTEEKAIYRCVLAVIQAL